MICYRDTTFCRFHDCCTKGDICGRALTDEVKEAAVEWWGDEHAPIATFMSRPECFDAQEKV